MGGKAEDFDEQVKTMDGLISKTKWFEPLQLPFFYLVSEAAIVL